MSTHTLKPAADYLPKLGKRTTGLFAAEVTADQSPAQQIETVRQAWKASVVNHVRDTLATTITGQLAEIVEEHEMLFGARPTDDTPGVLDAETAASAHDSDLDDAVKESFDDKFWAGVGASGMVELTVDTRADLPERRTELGQRLAGEIIANGTWLILTDAEAHAIIDGNPPKAAKADTPASPVHGTAEHPQTGITYATAWKTGVKLVKAALDSGSHDVMTITDELELCIDSDDILGTAGAQRLAPASTPEVVRACLQILAGQPGADPHAPAWTETLVMAAMEDGEAAVPEEAYKAEKSTLAAALGIEEPAKAPTTRKTPAEQTEGSTVAQEVMLRFLALSGMTEQAMADILGVSRGMINAAAKGRKTMDWTPERVAALKAAASEFATSVATFQEETGAL